MSERIGEVFWRIRCLAYLSIIHRLRGEAAETQRFAFRCLAIATEPEALDYVGVAKATLPGLPGATGLWTAADRRTGRPGVLGRTPTGYAFRWLALWPMMGVALTQGSLDQCLSYAQSLLTLASSGCQRLWRLP